MPINFDFTSGVLPAGITFSRASIGTYTNAAGVLITASNNVARFNYVAGASCLLVEPSATNLLVQSNNFSNAAWTGFGATINSSQFTSPDGTNNGWSIVSAGAANAGVYQLITFSNIPYTVSVWGKLISGAVPLRFILAGVLSGPIATSATLTRLSSVLTTPATTDQALTYFAAVAAGNIDGVYGMQVETGSVMTSYIPTTTAAVTRAADSAVFTIPSGINQLVYTFDDGSKQTVAVSPGSYTIPTNLSRPNIKGIVGSYSYDFTSGSLPPGITFTRASIGTYFNNAGTLLTAGNDVARMNYVGGVSCLLVEGSATNLCLQSNNFLTAPWAAGSAVATAAQFISPDGTNNGWMITSAGFGGYSQLLTFTAATYTLSAWLKQAANIPADFFIAGIDNVRAVSPTLTRTSATTAATSGTYFIITVATATPSIVMGFYGIQLELGSVPTSYIPTTTAAITRAADSAVFTIPAGVTQLTYTFDDNSTQVVSVTSGQYTIPTNLNRPNIKSVSWVVGAIAPTQLRALQTLSLAANTPLQLTATGTYNLTILNLGPGNLYVSSGSAPGPSPQGMLIPPLKSAPWTTTASATWLSSDQAGGVSIAAIPR